MIKDTSTPAPVDTGKIGDRRTLRFESIDKALAEVDRLVEAERAGRLRPRGNWTLGQALGHLATWVEFSYTGAPLRPPFFIRWVLKLRKRKFLRDGMRAGVKIPGVPGGTLATDPVPLDEAQIRLRQLLTRLQNEPPTAPHVALGLLTQEEWIALHLRHAELHLSFFAPA
jgi:hypothetical protein